MPWPPPKRVNDFKVNWNFLLEFIWTSTAPYLISTAISRNVPEDLGRLEDAMKLIFFFFFCKGRLHIFVSHYQNTLQCKAFFHWNLLCAAGFVLSSAVDSTRPPPLQGKGQPAQGAHPWLGWGWLKGNVSVSVCVQVCGEGKGKREICSLEGREVTYC